MKKMILSALMIMSIAITGNAQIITKKKTAIAAGAVVLTVATIYGVDSYVYNGAGLEKALELLAKNADQVKSISIQVIEKVQDEILNVIDTITIVYNKTKELVSHTNEQAIVLANATLNKANNIATQIKNISTKKATDLYSYLVSFYSFS
jgi:hypothetical protein